MSVSKEKNGTYKVQYYHTNKNGDRVLTTKRGFTKKNDAQEFDLKMRKRKKQKIDISGMLLKDFVFDYYYPYIESELKQKSVENKKNVINLHILNINNEDIASLKKKKLRDITVEEIIGWQNKKKKEGYSEGYLLSIRKELSSILNFAEKKYQWDDNPSANVPRMGKFNNRVRKDDWWTVDEFETFISKVDKNSVYFVIWNLLFYSGIRLGELLALKKKDISLENNCIYINETYARLKKKDVITKPKTESSERVVYLPLDTINILREYLVKQPNIQENDRVFQMVHRTVQKALARDIAKSGVRYISVHCLRHSHCAYLMSLESISMSVISQRMGHKDETITSQVYAHVYDKSAMSVANIMQEDINNRKNDEEGDS